MSILAKLRAARAAAAAAGAVADTAEVQDEPAVVTVPEVVAAVEPEQVPMAPPAADATVPEAEADEVPDLIRTPATSFVAYFVPENPANPLVPDLNSYSSCTPWVCSEKEAPPGWPEGCPTNDIDLKLSPIRKCVGCGCLTPTNVHRLCGRCWYQGRG